MISAVVDPGNITQSLTVALVGNPNSGKTTLFNALTGLRQKVGNYPGVTVEKKEGKTLLPNGSNARLIDLPGLYSLTPHSPDEVIAREVLMGLRQDTPQPDVILNVVDASNLERNLYLTSQLLDIGIPVVIALTMTDSAVKDGVTIQPEVLAKALKVPVIVVVASKKQGLPETLESLSIAFHSVQPELAWNVPEAILSEISALQQALQKESELSPRVAFAEAVTLLMQEGDHAPTERLSPSVHTLIRETRDRLADNEIDFASKTIEARYAWIAQVCKGVVQSKYTEQNRPISANERVDRVLMHPFWGYAFFVIVMTVVFQTIFSVGQGPASFIKDSLGNLGKLLYKVMPAGDLRALLSEGVIGGVGTTLAFLPQILRLFFFISLLEDTGYMARAAFLIDRLMCKVGLHGKSFVPLLSSFACAIPGIMATRTIGDRKARLITILVAPLMSCSARLPVYLLMISAFVPNRPLLKIGGLTLLSLPGATFASMYFLGMIAAFGVAWIFHKTLLKGVAPSFLLELPPYRLPSFKTVVLQMLERAGLFVRRAATIILAVSVVVWFLSYYPRYPNASPEEQLSNSYIGRIGHVIEPVMTPLGFNWKIGVGIASSFIAREVFVATMGTVYNVEDAEEKGNKQLQTRLQDEIDPRTGKHAYTPLTAVCLMVYYVLAMQCMSTFAVVRRETNGWKWPIFQLAYMSGLAWIVTFVLYQVGIRLHLGV